VKWKTKSCELSMMTVVIKAKCSTLVVLSLMNL